MRAISAAFGFALIAAVLGGTIYNQQRILDPISQSHAQEDDSDNGCELFEAAKADMPPGYSGLRLIAEDEIDLALAIADELSNDETPDNVDLVALMDRSGGGGALVFGHDGKVCALIKIDQEDWYRVVKALEGVHV